MSYGPYVTIQYLVFSGSGQIADPTIWPLSGFSQIVKNSIRRPVHPKYIIFPDMDYKMSDYGVY